MKQQKMINDASRAHVASEFTRLQANWSNNRWLCDKNIYRRDVLSRLKADNQVGRVSKQYQLCEYTAASTIGHCVDGWSFLGRAIASDLQGDPNSARHLGYYAELRAAMSLLATEGVGVFDRIHAVVNGKSRCRCFAATGTHSFAWEAFDLWAKSPKAAALLFSVIEPGGISISEWLQHFGVGSTFLAAEWLSQWGLDLRRFTEDRENRNVSSYRPTAWHCSRATSVDETIATVEQYWLACRPFGSHTFVSLDKQLLKCALELAFKNTHGMTPKRAPRVFEKQIDRMLHNISLGEKTEEQWKNFLTSSDSTATAPVLRDASASDGASHARHSKEVMARAILLLRVATGSVKAMLQSAAGVHRENMEFWWKPLGEDRGLWHNGEYPPDFLDLWADVRDAIEEVTRWNNAHPGGAGSYSLLWQECGAAAFIVGSAERIGLWGLGL